MAESGDRRADSVDVKEGVPVDWKQAGHAWGERATDWAYLFEPYARRANQTLFDRLGVGEGSRLVDIACGSGYAAALAAEQGAVVAGVDASEPLIAIARARTPVGDFRVGDMFSLPYPAGNFDVATSFNGIWKGLEAALREARRVVRPGGMVGMTFWGAPKRLGLLPYFMKVVELSPPDHGSATLNQGETGRPGVVEAMMEEAGLEFLERGVVEVVNEFPDLDIAARALAAAGPSWPALQAVGESRFVTELKEALRNLSADGVGVRIRSELGWATARVPDA
jgi:SAM-dependent methyltransferase